MTCESSPVRVYFWTLCVFLIVGLLLAGGGLAAEIWFGYSGAFNDAFTGFIILWAVGMVVGYIRAERRLKDW